MGLANSIRGVAAIAWCASRGGRVTRRTLRCIGSGHCLQNSRYRGLGLTRVGPTNDRKLGEAVSTQRGGPQTAPAAQPPPTNHQHDGSSASGRQRPTSALPPIFRAAHRQLWVCAVKKAALRVGASPTRQPTARAIGAAAKRPFARLQTERDHSALVAARSRCRPVIDSLAGHSWSMTGSMSMSIALARCQDVLFGSRSYRTAFPSVSVTQ